MSDIKNILLVGVGGQGSILASDILTKAAMLAGLDVKKSEIHGMSQRGGSVFSHVRFGKKVYSPVIPEQQADILLSLEEMETLRWLPFANPQTEVVVSGTRILPAMVETYPEGVDAELSRLFQNYRRIDPEQFKQKISNQKYFNVALLGIISNRLDFDDTIWKEAISSLVPEGTAEGNWEAFKTGQQAGKGN